MTFFIFQGPISSNFCVKQREKMHFFQTEASKWKGTLNFFDSDTDDKNRDYCTNRIEYESHLTLRRVFSYFHSVYAIFTQVFFAHPINLKGLVVYLIFFKDLFIFSGLILQNSRTKSTFFKFQESSRTKVKFKDFYRSVRTLSLKWLLSFSSFAII